MKKEVLRSTMLGFNEEEAIRLANNKDIIFGDDRKALKELVDKIIKEDGIEMEELPIDDDIDIRILQLVAFTVASHNLNDDIKKVVDRLIEATFAADSLIVALKHCADQIRENLVKEGKCKLTLS